MDYLTTHEVRYGDVDRFGHVNHLRLLEFFESARNPFFRDLADAEQQPCLLDIQGFVVAHLNADVHESVDAPARIVQVRTSVQRLGTSSATLHYELWHESMLCVTATSVLVFLADGKKNPLSEERRAFLSRYALSPAAPAIEA
jgi:acyl-CoA thioester hydrolase